MAAKVKRLLSEFLTSVFVDMINKSVNFSKLRFLHHLKAEQISFLLIYGLLLGLDNIWPRYNYLKIWNLRKQKKINQNIEKIAFEFVQMRFLAMHIINRK